MKVVNRKAKFNYKLEPQTHEAGISLTGDEVKAFRQNKVDLSNSSIKLIKNEFYLVNANLPGAKEPTRIRKLLLKRHEITSIGSKMKQKRLTFVPVSMYTTRRLIKLEGALGKHKKQFEKRESLKRKAIKRQMEQDLKGT